ncbi:two-component response regulator [Crocosphaera subtropica ATCC 51142]|uniref:Two-component response regulator n=1 Tax=Crocosphaera subtropica (strain ATCC 51142 / BH68) TaxID=43989 RepID=B1WR06_CROS5|nr:response regulator [Crocosphaera subtropica]ACB50064.1 two-component response regulator [Crocosphaera subtropica ATCC 51142]
MKNILIIDDIQSELTLLKNYLTKAGYTVVTATNGQEALEKISQKKPDVIVTDLMMPDMGGLDLCRKLKKQTDTVDIPIVACSAKNREVDKMWAFKQGVKAYVTKPCTQEDLVDVLQSVTA